MDNYEHAIVGYAEFVFLTQEFLNVICRVPLCKMKHEYDYFRLLTSSVLYYITQFLKKALHQDSNVYI